MCMYSNNISGWPVVQRFLIFRVSFTTQDGLQTFSRRAHKKLRNSLRAGHLTQCGCFGICCILLNQQMFRKYFYSLLTKSFCSWMEWFHEPDLDTPAMCHSMLSLKQQFWTWGTWLQVGQFDVLSYFRMSFRAGRRLRPHKLVHLLIKIIVLVGIIASSRIGRLGGAWLKKSEKHCLRWTNKHTTKTLHWHTPVFISHRPKCFWNVRKKLSHFSQNVWKYRLMHIVMSSFNTTVRHTVRRKCLSDRNISAKYDRNVSAKKNRYT